MTPLEASANNEDIPIGAPNQSDPTGVGLVATRDIAATEIVFGPEEPLLFATEHGEHSGPAVIREIWQQYSQRLSDTERTQVLALKPAPSTAEETKVKAKIAMRQLKLDAERAAHLVRAMDAFSGNCVGVGFVRAKDKRVGVGRAVVLWVGAITFR